MPYDSLRDFIENRLEPEGELVRVSAPVSPVLEMTEIQTGSSLRVVRLSFSKTRFAGMAVPMTCLSWLICLGQLSVLPGGWIAIRMACAKLVKLLRFCANRSRRGAGKRPSP